MSEQPAARAWYRLGSADIVFLLLIVVILVFWRMSLPIMETVCFMSLTSSTKNLSPSLNFHAMVPWP